MQRRASSTGLGLLSSVALGVVILMLVSVTFMSSFLGSDGGARDREIMETRLQLAEVAKLNMELAGVEAASACAKSRPATSNDAKGKACPPKCVQQTDFPKPPFSLAPQRIALEQRGHVSLLKVRDGDL